MNPSDILNQQFQLDFKSDLLSALNAAGTLDAQVVTELGKLSDKKTFLVAELKKAWEDRGTLGYYTPAKIIEMNLEH